MELKFKELLLYYVSENTLLFEIIEEIGMINTVKLLSVFGGQTIKIPDREFVREKIIDVVIYLQLHKNPKNKEEINRISNNYGISVRSLKQRYKKVKKDLENEVLQNILGNYSEIDNKDYTKEEMESFITKLL